LSSSYLDRSPKKGFVLAEFSKVQAAFSKAMSTLFLGRYKNSPPATISNPQSSRNLVPSGKFPTLLCHLTTKYFKRHTRKKCEMLTLYYLMILEMQK
jgi:hypothetical protein